MITDKLLMFSEAQAVTNTAASTDVIDLGQLTENVAISALVTRFEFWALVNTAAAAAVMQLNIQLQTSEE